MFYLSTHSTHFIYGYMASDIWLRTIQIAREETHCRHMGYSYRLTARVLLYAPSHRQDNTYDGLCYTSRGALAGMRNYKTQINIMDNKEVGTNCTYYHLKQTHNYTYKKMGSICDAEFDSRNNGRKEMFIE